MYQAYHFLDNQNLDCKKLSPKNSFISSKPRNEVVPKNWHIEHFFYTWWRDVKLKCPDWSSCSDFHHPIYRYKNNRNSLTQYNAQVLQELSYKKIFKDYSILSLTGLWQQIFNIWVSIHLYLFTSNMPVAMVSITNMGTCICNRTSRYTRNYFFFLTINWFIAISLNIWKMISYFAFYS